MFMHTWTSLTLSGLCEYVPLFAGFLHITSFIRLSISVCGRAEANLGAGSTVVSVVSMFRSPANVNPGAMNR